MQPKRYFKLKLNIPLWWPSLPFGKWLRCLLPNLGNVLFTLLIVGGLLYAQNAGALSFRAPALASDSTTAISYQGRLTDSGGNPVNSSGIGMCFRLYNTDTGSSPLWEECHIAVPVEDGLFHVLLGSTDPIPVSLLTNNSTLWLGITVGSDSEMDPREQIASVPYAMVAQSVAGGVGTGQVVDGAVTTEKIANGAVTSAKLEHSGPHIPITPDENGLVKMAVLRQDDTINTYSKDQVILTGWGWMISDGSDEYLEEAVSFGVTFATPPIVILGNPGKSDSADPSAISDFVDNNRGTHISARNISTTGFTVWIQHVDIGTTLYNGQRYGYSWIAIGTLE